MTRRTSVTRSDLPTPACKVRGCPKPRQHKGLGLCKPHYDRLRRTGDPGGPTFRTLKPVVWKKG